MLKNTSTKKRKPRPRKSRPRKPAEPSIPQPTAADLAARVGRTATHRTAGHAPCWDLPVTVIDAQWRYGKIHYLVATTFEPIQTAWVRSLTFTEPR